MKPILIFFSSGASIAVAVWALVILPSLPERIQVGDRKTRVLELGQGPVTVVFETLGEAPLEMWTKIQSEVARHTATFAYDHPGYWASDRSAPPRDGRHIALDLRETLRAANASPPYLFVGYSFGGPYARIFADMHPDEVVGLILIDPTSETFMAWLRDVAPEMNKIPSRSRFPHTERAYAEDTLRQAAAASLPAMPITVLSGAKPDHFFPKTIFERWVQAHEEWLAAHPEGQHIISARSGHELPFSEPQLAADAIKGMLDEIIDNP